MEQKVAQKTAMDRLVDTFFAGSTAATVSALLGMKSKEISEEELNELSSIIEEARNKQT
jgi:predicted transcriptional regulator